MSSSSDRLSISVMSDLLARAIVIVLFSLLSVNLLNDFRQTGHITGLLLLASESLVVLLTLIRRRTSIVDRSAAGLITTMLSMAGPPLLRAVAEPGMVADLATAAVSAAGLSLVVAGKITLGRSFGIAPANRGVVVAGPYGLVRHPIYTGYLITHVAFLAAHPTPWNALVIVVADGALIVRALIEERVLQGDELYRSYCQRVGWHLVPGVF